jgi:hypothetical protein
MALIVEDGTSKADAESYVSVVDASAYHSARGNSAWAALASDTVREQCLRKATDYMQQVYRGRWAGYRKTSTQALDWPRQEVPFNDAGGYAYYADDAVPVEVKNACAELAWRAASGELAADLSQRVKREKVDAIEVEYTETGPQYAQYRAIDNLLAPLLKSTGGAFRGVVRA